MSHDVQRDGAGADTSIEDEPLAACIFHPFERCEDPFELDRRNDTRSSPSRPFSSAGCVHNETLVTLEGSVEGKLCHTQPADWYEFVLLSCTDQTLRTEVRLTARECPVEVVRLELRINGTLKDCEDPEIDCQIEDDSTVVRLLYRPTGRREIRNLAVGVFAGRESAGFEYELSMKVN
ncbi:MAG: hypothetical protein H0U74_23155 [Bradymonadaceae bacterium]|nr:hypothetical protein [Lujinxingiaceae bacterium]